MIVYAKGVSKRIVAFHNEFLDMFPYEGLDALDSLGPALLDSGYRVRNQAFTYLSTSSVFR